MRLEVRAHQQILSAKRDQQNNGKLQRVISHLANTVTLNEHRKKCVGCKTLASLHSQVLCRGEAALPIRLPRQ